jgi:hypothetical protein
MELSSTAAAILVPPMLAGMIQNNDVGTQPLFERKKRGYPQTPS